MALELEQKIMSAIGLGSHYNWFNGSGSCRGRRQEAAGRLRMAIQGAYDDKEDIAAPDITLCHLAERVAVTEESEYSLTDTWVACSYIIQAHINAFDVPHDQKGEIYRYIERYITEKYLAQKTDGRDKWLCGGIFPNSFGKEF